MADGGDEGAAPAPASGSGKAQDCTFTVRVVASLAGAAEAAARARAAAAAAEAAGEAPPAAPAFVPRRIPRMRFTFNGVNVTTDDVTAWPAAGAAAEADDAEADAEAGEGGGKVEEGDSKAGEALPPCARVYERKFAGVRVDRAWLERLHAHAQLTLFVGDKAGASDGDEGKAEADGSSTSDDALPPHRNYVDAVMLDLSPMLDNDTVVDSRYAMTPSTFTGAGNASALPAPPEGFATLRVTVTVDKPLLTPQLVRELNPLTVKVKQAVDLPGVHMADGDPSLAKYVTPTPYHLMRKHCTPVFACFQFFDGNAISRVVRTPRVPYGRRVVWNVKTVFLAGLLSPDQMRELIVQSPLIVEVHDRDVPTPASEVAEQRARWEGIVAGTWVDPAEVAAKAAAAAVAAEEAAAEAAAAAAEAAERAAAMPSKQLQRRQSKMSTARSKKSQATAKSEPVVEEEPGPEPVDVFEVDRMVEKELAEEVASAGDHNAHATASVRLDPLLERGLERLQVLRRKEARRLAQRAKAEMEARNADRMAMYERECARCKAAGKGAPKKPDLETNVPKPPPLPEDPQQLMDLIATELGPQKIKKSLDLVPAKRRVIPKGGVVNYDLTSEQRVTREPGAYTHEMSRLKVEIVLTRPLYVQPPHEKPPPLPFERAVFCMPYKEARLLRSVLAVIKEVNNKAFPGVSIRSHQMDAGQMAAADAGTLDVITGFQLLDDKWRLVVVEGLSNGAMRLLHRRVPRSFANSPTMTYLANPEVRFQHRMYTAFHLAPKDVRLRDPLSKLVEAPQIYDRAQVTSLTFSALYKLFELRNCTRLAQVKTQRLFPSVDMLLEIENKYGDTVTLEDMTGKKQKVVARRTRSRQNRTAPAAGTATPGSGMQTPVPGGDTAGAGEGVRFDETAASEGKRGQSRQSHHDKLDVLDFTNPTFDKMRRERAKKTVDFITLNKTAFPTGGERHKTTSVDVEGLAPPGGEVYNYSGQRLNYAEWQKELMRQRLSKDKKSTYTYSKDFQSLTVCLVNEAEMAQLEKKASQARWTTKRGFVYPAPRDPIEFARHPRAPSESRKEELAQPWVEPAKSSLGTTLPDLAGDNRPRFDTVPVRGEEFGYVDAEGSRNPDFFKSVFLCGDGLAAEEAAAKKAAEEEWQAKVVVDNVRFTPHFTAEPTQLNKLTGMLKGDVKHKGLRIVHKARLPSGKPTAPPVAAPASIFTGQDYEDPVDFTTTLKPNIKEEFLGTDAQGNKVEFFTHIHKDANKPKSLKLQHRRKHPPLFNAEKRGDRWFPDIHKKPAAANAGRGGGSARRGSARKK